MDVKARELMDVLLQMAKDKQELPDQIQKLLEPDAKEGLKDQPPCDHHQGGSAASHWQPYILTFTALLF